MDQFHKSHNRVCGDVVITRAYGRTDYLIDNRHMKTDTNTQSSRQSSKCIDTRHTTCPFLNVFLTTEVTTRRCLVVVAVNNFEQQKYQYKLLIYHIEPYTNLYHIFIHIKGGLHDSDYI